MLKSNSTKAIAVLAVAVFAIDDAWSTTSNFQQHLHTMEWI